MRWRRRRLRVQRQALRKLTSAFMDAQAARPLSCPDKGRIYVWFTMRYNGRMVNGAEVQAQRTSKRKPVWRKSWRDWAMLRDVGVVTLTPALERFVRERLGLLRVSN